MLRLFLAVLGLLALAACGASSSSEILGTSSASTADGGPGDSVDAATGSAAADASAPAPRLGDAGSANRCDRLLADVERLRAEAIGCSLTELNPQCDQLVDDVCCKLVVSGSSMNVAKLELAVRAFKDAKCTVDCKAIACPNAPSKVCQPMSGSKGSCEQ